MTTLLAALLTVAQAAEILNVSVDRTYALIRRGLLPAVRLGNKQVRVDPDALHQFIREGGRSDADVV
jgi:excisionase family DNA binding protein